VGQILIDIMVIVFLAVAFLMPKGTLGLSPAIPATMGQPIERERLAELEDALYAEPNNETTACELADAYLAVDQSEWALATLAPFAHSDHYRPHLVRATALAERLHANESVGAANAGLKVCDHDPKCDDAARARLTIIARAMQALVDQHIDGIHDPARAKQAVAEALRSTRSGVRLPKPPAPKVAPHAP
jgi:hypothetical protein